MMRSIVSDLSHCPATANSSKSRKRLDPPSGEKVDWRKKADEAIFGRGRRTRNSAAAGDDFPRSDDPRWRGDQCKGGGERDGHNTHHSTWLLSSP